MQKLGYQPWIAGVFFANQEAMRTVDGYDIPGEYVGVLLQILASWGFWADYSRAQRAL
jgi:hypothetical protein